MLPCRRPLSTDALSPVHYWYNDRLYLSSAKQLSSPSSAEHWPFVYSRTASVPISPYIHRLSIARLLREATVLHSPLVVHQRLCHCAFRMLHCPLRPIISMSHCDYLFNYLRFSFFGNLRPPVLGRDGVLCCRYR